MKLRALIADDEPLARERLRFLLAAQEEVEIAGECRNGREVAAALQSLPVDVLFLDIEMPGRGGFEVLERMAEQMDAARTPATVFVTAHPQFALRAFEVHALDYLTKPVEAERLSATLAHVRERMAANRALATQEQLRAVLSSLEAEREPLSVRREYPTRLLVPNGSRDTFVAVNEIDWIEAADYYSCLHVGTRRLMLRETIKQLATMLDPRSFVRIHRSAIVNVERVREILREGRNEGAVVLHSGERLRMSRSGWQTLIAAGRQWPA